MMIRRSFQKNHASLASLSQANTTVACQKQQSISSTFNASARFYTVLKGQKRERRLRKKYPTNVREKMPMSTSKLFEADPVFLSEPQIMYPLDAESADAELMQTLRTPYLTSHQPSDAISVLLYQQHLLNLAQQKRDDVRSEYKESAAAQDKLAGPQILQDRYHMNLEDYARMYTQKLKNAWIKRRWHKTLRVVDEMERMNVPLLQDHYKYIITNLVDCGEYPRAEYFYNQMQQNGVEMTPQIFEKLFEGCLHDNDVQLAERYYSTLNELGFVMDSQGYVHLMKLHLNNHNHDKVEAFFNEMQEVGHPSTEETWVLHMKSKAHQGLYNEVEDMIHTAGNDDYSLSTSMLNQLLRAMSSENQLEEIVQFFKSRYEEEMLNRNVETYEILLQKLYERKQLDSIRYYYNDMMEYAVDAAANVKPTDEIFLIALKAARDNNFDFDTTEQIWKDMKSMDARRKYHPDWKKPITMKDQRYYYIKARLTMDAEHREIIREVRKVKWIRTKLEALERSENAYQRRLKMAELRKAAEKGGFAYATHEGEDFIPLTAEELEAFSQIPRT